MWIAVIKGSHIDIPVASIIPGLNNLYTAIFNLVNIHTSIWFMISGKVKILIHLTLCKQCGSYHDRVNIDPCRRFEYIQPPNVMFPIHQRFDFQQQFIMKYISKTIQLITSDKRLFAKRKDD